MKRTCFPLNSHVGPHGNNLPVLALFSTKSGSVSMPSFFANKSSPVMTSCLMAKGGRNRVMIVISDMVYLLASVDRKPMAEAASKI